MFNFFRQWRRVRVNQASNTGACTRRTFLSAAGLASLPLVTGCTGSGSTTGGDSRSQDLCYEAALEVADAHVGLLPDLDTDHPGDVRHASADLVLLGELAAPGSHEALAAALKKRGLAADRQLLRNTVAKPHGLIPSWYTLDSAPKLQLCASPTGTHLGVYSITPDAGRTKRRFSIPPQGNDLLPYPCLWSLVASGLKDVFGHDANIYASFAGVTTDWSKLAAAVAISYTPGYLSGRALPLGAGDRHELSNLRQRQATVMGALTTGQ